MEPADSTNGDEESIITPLLAQKSFANSSSQVAIVGANVCPIESLDYEWVWVFFFSPLLDFEFCLMGLFLQSLFLGLMRIELGWFPFD